MILWTITKKGPKIIIKALKYIYSKPPTSFNNSPKVAIRGQRGLRTLPKECFHFLTEGHHHHHRHYFVHCQFFYHLHSSTYNWLRRSAWAADCEVIMPGGGTIDQCVH